MRFQVGIGNRISVPTLILEYGEIDLREYRVNPMYRIDFEFSVQFVRPYSLSTFFHVSPRNGLNSRPLRGVNTKLFAFFSDNFDDWSDCWRWNGRIRDVFVQMSKAANRLRLRDIPQVRNFPVLVHGQCALCTGRRSQFVPLLCVRKPEHSQGIAAIRTIADDQDILSVGIVSQGLSNTSAPPTLDRFQLNLAFGFQSVKFAYVLAQQIHCDIFFIDWERPRVFEHQITLKPTNNLDTPSICSSVSAA